MGRCAEGEEAEPTFSFQVLKTTAAPARAAEEQTAAQAALLGPLAAADTTASLGGAPMRRPSAIVAAVLHQHIAAERAAPMLAPLGYHMNRLCDDVLKRWREFEREMNRSDEDGGDAAAAHWPLCGFV